MSHMTINRRAGLGAAAVALALPAAFAAAPSAAADTTPEVASTSVSPAVIPAGGQALQTVRLTAPAPAGGLGVEVISVGFADGNYQYSTDGGHVRVPEGETSVTFPIRLEAYEDETVVPLVARRHGVSARTDVTVRPLDWREQTVTNVDLDVPGDAKAVVAGTKVTGSVELAAPAGAGGTSVDLRVAHVSGLPGSPTPKIPRYAVVPAGSTRGTFTMEYPAVPVSGIGITDVAADLGHSPMRVAPLLVPKQYTVGVVRELRAGARNNIGAVGLGNRWHPFGAVIELTSHTPGVTVPAKVEIPADEAGENFDIRVDESVPAGTKVKISAKWVLSTAGTVATEAVVAG
ncbi:hypothetical protein [Actinomadura algeriensis]|uniref:Uncharacterized protein n=1 Tax=Actinomadura algeriensis TaxID=1679523 RepID=A0ABR9JJG3_9ACTN|nr:hypothetical protein [Actinomadura algeriensis]MBE1530693.1 hypothetical protein [Actinomadura algeriensis]